MHTVIDDSLASKNAGSGIVGTTGGGRLTMILNRSVAANNHGTGVTVDGSNTEAHISSSAVFGNGTGVSATSGASLISYKNNEIKLNGSNGAPTGVVGFD